MSMHSRYVFLCLLLSALAVVACARVTDAAAEGSATPIGVAKVDITPEDPVRMYGYASRKTESEGIAGRLHAKAMALGDGDDLAVLLTVDCGAVPADIRAEVYQRVHEKTGLKPERFMLCNSHNHSGPNLKGTDSMNGTEHEHLAKYAEALTDRLTEVILNAVEQQRPCRLDWSAGEVGIAANRRVLKDGKWTGFGAVPEAPVDHSLPVLRVSDPDGKLVAVVVNYACHCTTLRGNFKRIHGDWAACAQEYIEADHPGALALITIGCGADADPCPHSTVELCEKHGRAMADEVARVLQGSFQPIEPKLVARQEPLSVPFLNPPPLDELEQKVGKSWALKGLLDRLRDGEKLEPRTFEISTWVFGNDLAMVFMSDEVVVDYALRMKREMDGSRLWITAYTNEIRSYIASERILAEGGYEARNSLSNLVSFGDPQKVKPSMEERIIRQIAKLLPEEFKKPRENVNLR
jgi:hypothetical protein